MRSFRLFLLAVSGMAALAACNRESARLHSDSRDIVIQAGIGDMTKVTTTGNTAAFDTGDQVSLYAWTGSATAVPDSRVVDDVRNTLGSDGKWIPQAKMLWADMVTPHFFVGIYPPRSVSDFAADAFSLTPADYESSDLLIATNLTGLKAQQNPVTLSFDHAMAKLYVNLQFRNQWETEPTVTAVETTAKSSCTVDYLAKAVTATGSAVPVALTRTDNKAWSNLQVPQDGVRSITVKIDGKDYVFTHTADIPLTGGKHTTVNLTVGRNVIELASISINDWTAGATIDNGEAQTED